MAPLAGAEAGASGGGFRREVSCWIAALRTHYLVLLVFTVIVYFPRLYLSYAVFFLAQILRLVARTLGVETGRPVKNRRILVVTDYMPPQTHGIAIRCHAYVKHMREQGHEVIVFCTAYEASKETSFDHPNIPAVVNPFNLSNRIGYNPGVKLAWYLGANSWDVVHLFFPSLIGCFVLSVCSWRRIPVYCSHHVEVVPFARKHVPFTPVCNFGIFMYNLIGKWPAMLWGTLNAAPTLCFANEHLGTQREESLRCVPSGTHDIFRPTAEDPNERTETRSTRFGVQDDKVKVIIMVQRLSVEKGTERIFPALRSAANSSRPQTAAATGEEDAKKTVDAVLVVAGDGASRRELELEAKRRKLRVVFLGNVPHHELPRLYRAADCFVTMSMTETFGLTCLEAAMCGCAPVVPYCGVFNEIWNERIPRAWRYDVASAPELAAAITAALENGREWLSQHPVDMTWKNAADNLLAQYEECISLQAKRRESLKEIVRIIDHCFRVAFLSLIASWALKRYYMVFRRFFASVVPGSL